jgi:hypothetical protein
VTRLRAKPEGGIRVLEPPGDTPPDQLVKLRTYRDVLEPIIAAYGEVEIVIRPATPIPPPTVWPGDIWFVKRTSPRRHKPARKPKPADEPERPNPNACVHCGRHCSPGDLGSWLGADGRWVHLDCDLAATTTAEDEEPEP